MENETMIQKKKSPFLIIIIVAILIMALVICYFSFFSETAIRERKIKNLIASAEKYLDDLDYENAIAEYEAVLKLDSKADGVLDDYVDTVLAYAEEVAENNLGEAVDILNDAVNILYEISDGDENIENQAERLREIADEYQAESDELNTSSESQSDDTPIGETSSDNNSGREDILPYEQGGYIIFGAYEQDGDLANGPEPIEWEVLGTDENGTLLVSRYILDCQPYNVESGEVTWEMCSLRSWLNDDFLNSAFTTAEQAVINTTNVINGDNPYYGTPGGTDTSDMIFCLSLDEVLNHYTFETFYDNSYKGYSQQLIVPVTQYAKDEGVSSRVITEEDDYIGGLNLRGYTRDCIGLEGGFWWLRSPGLDNTKAINVNYDGSTGVDNYLYFTNVEHSEGIRPALYIAQ